VVSILRQTLAGDRGFESISLQRGVWCEPNFRGRIGSGSGGGDNTPPRHPLIEGMFQSLPANGQPWTLDEAADWLHAAAYNLRFAYKLKGKIKIDIHVERQAGE